MDKLSKIPNYDKVLSDMAQMWRKYHAGKFVLTNLSGKSDDFLKTIISFEAKVNDALGNFSADVVRKVGNKLTYLEYKSWAKGSFKTLMNAKEGQFKKQFLNYIKNGDFEYVFDKNKLLKDVVNPEEFVKGEFQEFFRKNADDMFKPISKGGVGIENLKKVFGDNIDDVSDFLEIIEDINHPVYRFIKVE